MNIKSNSKSIFYLFIFLFNSFFVAPPNKQTVSPAARTAGMVKKAQKKRTETIKNDPIL